MFVVLFFLAVLAYWFSIGCTEAWKWRMDAKKTDDNRLITYNSYHLWRVLNTLSVYVAIVSAAIMPESLLIKALLGITGMVAGWALYERVMSFVEKDNFMTVRGNAWHLVEDVYVRRFSAKGEIIMFLAATVSFIYIAVWA